jgi:hypothetical protein
MNENLAKIRLDGLDETINKYYKKLNFVQKRQPAISGVNSQFEASETIDEEILPALRKYEAEYTQILHNHFDSITIIESDAKELVHELSAMTQKIATSKMDLTQTIGTLPLAEVLSELTRQLESHKDSYAVKVKLTLPLIPLILALEADWDVVEIIGKINRSIRRRW